MGKTSYKVGDVVKLNLNPTEGGEKGKIRPCLVLVGSGHPWGLVVIVPITEDTGARNAKLFVPIPHNKETGLDKPSCVDCFQVRCVAESRILELKGKAPDDVLENVRTRLAAILDIGEEHVT